MDKKKIISEPNPSLKIIRDNKPKWYLPESRREGYRNLHKINRYGLLYRSDLVLKLNKKIKIYFRLSVLNALNEVYISDAQNNDSYNAEYAEFDAKSAGVFFGMGRRINLSAKLTF